jgi:hypothetical protein
MSKDLYSIGIVTKKECEPLLMRYHYLKDKSRGFKSGINYGLFVHGSLVGVCIYTGFPVPELAKGMYGLERGDQRGFYELSRLCLTPCVQRSEHNLASWFVSRTLKEMKRKVYTRAILSYADDEHHKGTVYRACNFKYYGLTDKRKDFWILQEGGGFVKHSRGKTKGVAGEWRNRSRKHRFVLTFDKTLRIRWEEKP